MSILPLLDGTCYTGTGADVLVRLCALRKARSCEMEVEEEEKEKEKVDRDNNDQRNDPSESVKRHFVGPVFRVLSRTSHATCKQVCVTYGTHTRTAHIHEHKRTEDP